MPSPNKLAEIIRKVAQRGPRFVGTYLKDVLAFDLVHSTDTRGRKTGNSASAENIYYVPSFTSVIEATLDTLRNTLGEAFHDCQFVDIGSGKGKAVLVYAMRYGAEARHAPVGIEYDPALCAIANANIAKLGFARLGAAVRADDARNIRAHIAGERLILFLYNPFFGSLFHEFVAQLEGVPHAMIYVDPVEKAHLLARGYRIEAQRSGRYNADTWIVASKWC